MVFVDIVNKGSFPSKVLRWMLCVLSAILAHCEFLLILIVCWLIRASVPHDSRERHTNCILYEWQPREVSSWAELLDAGRLSVRMITSLPRMTISSSSV